jgi:NAD-dependent dihydropyrimidine dehydrogenase PreA subunit
MFFNRKHTRTAFVLLDTQKCKACWKCIDNCPNQVINKIDLPWHKHARIAEPDACIGCLNCVDICQYNAYSLNNGAKQVTEKIGNRTLHNFLINNLLLVSGLVMVFSGLVLQLGFHMGGPDAHQFDSHSIRARSIEYEQLREVDTSKIVCGFNYFAWTAIHKFVIVFFSLFIICHSYLHWKWYKGVIREHLIRKNRLIITLSLLFLLVAATGLIPWIIDLSGGTSISRMFFIEIHDKLTFILIVLLLLHMVKRANWFGSAYSKLKR